jgi:hypothetical protein
VCGKTLRATGIPASADCRNSGGSLDQFSNAPFEAPSALRKRLNSATVRQKAE